jgi:hypothetical protein
MAPRTPRSTAQRGLGGVHQAARQAALAAMADGEPCARCELRGVVHPMYRALITRRPSGRYVAPLLDLDDFPGRAFGGPQIKRLSWRRCNRRAGQRLSVAIQATRRAAVPSRYDRW